MKRDTLHSGMFAEWTKKALEEKNLSQAELARRLTDRLRRNIHTTAVNKILKRERALAADEMLAIAEITGYPPLISLEGKILENQEEPKQGVNEAYLVKLFSVALEWRGLPVGAARNLSVACVEAARIHPDRQDIELTDEELRHIALALAAALDAQAPK